MHTEQGTHYSKCWDYNTLRTTDPAPAPSTLSRERHLYAIISPVKLGTDPMSVDGCLKKMVSHKLIRYESSRGYKTDKLTVQTTQSLTNKI